MASGQEWWSVYGLGGELVAEYLWTAPTTVQKEYGYRDGQILIVGESGNVRWLVTDHLGSTRMTAEASGSLTGMKRQDYLPFGEDLYAGLRRNGGNGQYGYEPPASTVRQKFTGYERDGETGLDFAQARYYSNMQGRFTTPDEPLIDQWRRDPQTWSLYSYVRNNPLKFYDPTGMWKELGPGVWQWEENDTWEGLAKLLNVSVTILQNAFPNTPLGPDTVLGVGSVSDLMKQAGINTTDSDPGALSAYLYLNSLFRRYCPVCKGESSDINLIKNWYLGMYGRNDGLVPDPFQSPLSVLINGARFINPDSLSADDYRRIYTSELAGSISIAGAKKADIKFIDYLVKKYGLSKEARRILHDEITGLRLSKEDIEAIAKSISEWFKK